MISIDSVYLTISLENCVYKLSLLRHPPCSHREHHRGQPQASGDAGQLVLSSSINGRMVDLGKRQLDFVGENNDLGRMDFNPDGEESNLSLARWKQLIYERMNSIRAQQTTICRCSSSLSPYLRHRTETRSKQGR